MNGRLLHPLGSLHLTEVSRCRTATISTRLSTFLPQIIFSILFCSALAASSVWQTPALDPNQTAAQLEAKGDTLRQQKLFADAIDCYHQAVRKGADTAALHNKIGFTEMRRQHYDEARKEFERAVKRDKHFAGAYNNLGAMEYFRAKYGRAIDAYRHAIEIDGSLAMYHKNLANAYLAHNDFDKAVAEYFVAVKLDPAIFESGKGEGNLIDPASAPDPGRYYYMVAKSMAKANDLDRCLSFLKHAMEEDATIPKKVVKDPDFADALKDQRFVDLLKNPPQALR